MFPNLWYVKDTWDILGAKFVVVGYRMNKIWKCYRRVVSFVPVCFYWIARPAKVAFVAKSSAVSVATGFAAVETRELISVKAGRLSKQVLTSISMYEQAGISKKAQGAALATMGVAVLVPISTTRYNSEHNGGSYIGLWGQPCLVRGMWIEH